MSPGSPRASWWPVVAFAAGHFAMALFGFVLFGDWPPGIVIWPATGVAVGGLLSVKSVPRSVLLTVVGVSTLIADAWNGLGTGASLGYAVTEMIGTAVAAGVIDRTGTRDPVAAVLRSPWRTGLGGILGAAAASFSGLALVGPAPGLTAAEDVTSRGMAGFVGILIFAPAVVAVVQHGARPAWSVVLRNVAIGGAGGTVVVLAFVTAGRIEGPVMYLAFPAMMLAAVFVGGRNLTVILAAMILALSTLYRGGLGPFGTEGPAQVLQIQIFYSILMISTASIALVHRRSMILGEQMSQILEAARNPVMVVGSDESIGFANQAAQEIYGDDVLGKSLSELWGPNKLARVLEAEGSAEIETPHVPLEVTADRFSSEDGESYVLLVRDLTERRRAERERRNLLQVVESSPDFVGFSTPSGEILYLSPGARSMVGYGDGPVSEPIGSFAPDWARDLIRDVAVPAALDHGIWRGEAAYLAPDGHEIPVAQVVMAHRNDAGEVEMLSTIAHDLSDRVRMEQDRQDLIDNAVHDLRNTLVAVGGAAEMLTGDLGAERSIDRRLLEIMTRGVTQLNDLIGDLVASKQAGTIEPDHLEPIDLLALAKQVVSLHVVEAAKARVSLVVDGQPAMVWGDRAQLHRLAENLVTNAIKYSPGGGAVSVSVMPREGWAQLTVHDQGIGIDESDIDDMFTRHHRAGTARQAGIAGTGLGLAICKQIAVAHGGSIDVDSSRGVGSTFRVRLRLVSSEESKKRPHAEMTAAD